MGSAREYLGEFEQVVLLALARRDEAYGAAIHAEILEASGRDVSIPAVYVTLKRLEKKGLVTSAVRRPTDGGRAKKFYTLQPEGHAALARSRALLERLWHGVEVAAEESS